MLDLTLSSVTRGLGLVTVSAGLMVASQGPSVARACGGFFCVQATVAQPPVQSAERIVFVQEEDGTTEAIVQILYTGDPVDFSWIVPVEAEPTLDVSDPAMFDELDLLTQPTYQGTPAWSGDAGGCGVFPDDGGGSASLSAEGLGMDSSPVEIVSEQTIGFFATTVLTSEDPGALEAWLVDNDYEVPPGSSEIIAEYVDQGYYWVAVKLTPDADVGALEPLVIRYQGEPCIPVLLTAISTTPVLDVYAYFIGDAPYRPENYEAVPLTEDAVRPTDDGFTNYRTVALADVDMNGGLGFVTELVQPTEDLRWRATNPGLVELLDRGTTLTRLYSPLRQSNMVRDPEFVADETIAPVPQNRVFAENDTIPAGTLPTMGPSGGGGGGCAVVSRAPALRRLAPIAVPLVAAGVALGLSRRARRRRRRPAGHSSAGR